MSYRQSEHVKIRDVKNDIERAYNVLADYDFDVGIKDKNALRFRLLTEEVLRLVKQILDDRSVELWFEGDNRVSRIVLESEGDLLGDQKEMLGSITTSGEINEERGFFGTLAKMFLINETEESTWSLKEYQEQLRTKKAEDKLSIEAWEDLERSLVANLADDIEITSTGKKVRMVVTKDFSQSLLLAGSASFEASSGLMMIGTGKDVEKELGRAEDVVSELSLDKKNALRAKLVLEETLGMLKEMAESYQAVVWLEKYKNSYCIRLTAKTEMDFNKKNEFISLSTNHKNDSVKGFMDKVSDVIENGLLSYENAANLTQKYGGGLVNYGTMGMYGSLEGINECGLMWSLYDYRNSLNGEAESNEACKEAWDELEKSIVANIASDVLVGVKGNKVDMTIICKIV